MPVNERRPYERNTHEPERSGAGYFQDREAGDPGCGSPCRQGRHGWRAASGRAAARQGRRGASAADRASAGGHDRRATDASAARKIGPLTMRTRSAVVTFGRPFVLKGFADAIPGGSYVVETEEEPLPTVLQSAYRQTTTWLTLPSQEAAGGTELIVVDPAE